jgi:hypothetical protein
MVTHQRQTPQLPPTDLATLPEKLRTRLRAEGVTSLSQWRGLGRKRLAIFGITTLMARQLDELAKGAPT